MKLLALASIGAIAATSVCDKCPTDKTCYYAATSNTMFIECCNGEEHVLPCPPTYFWDDAMKSCSPVKPGPGPSPGPSPPSNICSACPWDIECYFSVSFDDTQFIQCSNGQPVVHTCPTGLVFNADLNVCDWPPHITYCDTECPNKACIRPSPDSYIQYFSCPAGLQNCPVVNGQQTVFDPKIEACVCRECVKLTTLSVSGTCSCPGGVSTCFYEGKTNTEFIECCDGTEYPLECPAGYVWNIGSNACVIPGSVDPVHPTSGPTPSNICANCPWDIECYYATSDASKFIQCSNGKPVVHSCPSGLVWDNTLHVCDWPSHPTYCEQQCPNKHCIIPSPDSSIQYFDCPSGLQNCGKDRNGQQMEFDNKRKACVCANCL